MRGGGGGGKWMRKKRSPRQSECEITLCLCKFKIAPLMATVKMKLTMESRSFLLTWLTYQHIVRGGCDSDSGLRSSGPRPRPLWGWRCVSVAGDCPATGRLSLRTVPVFRAFLPRAGGHGLGRLLEHSGTRLPSRVIWTLAVM